MNTFMARLTQVSFWGPETLRGNGASARAKHQQATAEKVSAVTTERINMLNTLKRKIALGAVAAVGAAGLVTIAAPAANAAVISAFTISVNPQRAVSGASSAAAGQIVAAVTLTGSETGTLRGVFTAAPTPAAADSSTAADTRNVAVGDTITAYVNAYNTAADDITFTAGKSSGVANGASAGAGAAKFNTAGTYSVRWWFDRNNDTYLDADEAYLNSSFAIGGAPASISLSSAALTVAGTAAKTFGVLLKDASGNATRLNDTLNERVTVLASIPATSAETLTVAPQNADGGAAASGTNSAARKKLVNGTGGNATYSAATFMLASDTTTASTGAMAITASLTGAAVGTIVFNLGGSLSPIATGVTGTLTSSAVALAKSIKLANTTGVTAKQTYYKAPAAVDTGSVNASGSLTANPMVYYANSASVPQLTYALTGTAGSIVNVKVDANSSAGVLAATTPVTIGADGTATYTVTPTTATGAITVHTNLADAAATVGGTDVALTVNYASSAVSGGVATALGSTHSITMSPDISSVTNLIAKTASTNTVKVTVKDQFGTAMQFYTVKGTLSATSRNAAATIATQVTGADGVATISLTDASTSTTNLSDVLTVDVYAPGSGTSLVLTSAKNVATITYSASGAYASLTVTGGTTTTTTKSIYPLTSDADGTNIVTLANVLKDSTGAAITGVALTYTGTAGVYFINALGLPAATVTAASGTSVVAYGTTPGVATVTIAGGGLSATQTFTVKASLRVRTVAATATGNRITGTVKDGFGNPVAGATLSFATTSAGVFGSGVTSTTAVTDATGSASAVVNSADGKAVSATISVALSSAGAGNTDETALLADLPVTGFTAGVATASVTAALPASSATNGDAASAAAQKATDAKIADIATAVTNLSTTVAGLVASLVAQIKDTKAAITDTQKALAALAAVVKKIQVKVKA